MTTSITTTGGNDLPVGVGPRDLTVDQRRELFSKAKKEHSPDTDDELIPFNTITLDHVLRLYGLARNGTVYQIHGDDGGQQSVLAYAVLREYQRTTGGPVGIFTFGRTIEPGCLRGMGLEESLTIVKSPTSIEDSVKIAVDQVKRGIRLFMFASIPFMRSNARWYTDARDIEQFYSVITPYIAKYDCALLMINHSRSTTSDCGSAPEVLTNNVNWSPPGGHVNRDAASAVIEVRTVNVWFPGEHEDPFVLEVEAHTAEEYIAEEVRLRTLKNKVSYTGNREGTIWIRPASGVDENISIRQLARQLGLIANDGKRWFVGECAENAIKVYDDMRSALEDLVNKPNKEVLGSLKALIIQKLAADASIGRLEAPEAASKHLACGG
jgi:hypothetical protein